MDHPLPDEPPVTRAAHWLRPNPAEVIGLAVLLLGAITASGIWWFQALQRPESLVNDAGAVGTDSGAVGTDSGAESTPPPAASGDERSVDPEVTVHVTGAVSRPGLVTLPAGARVGDAVAAVGGLAEGAAEVGVNLARRLADGEHVHVPAEGEPPTWTEGSSGDDGPPGSGTPSPGIAADGRVDLNRATREELETLPGVGPARAEAIVAHREEHGPFAVPGDLRGVRGIGEASFQALADRVTVG